MSKIQLEFMFDEMPDELRNAMPVGGMFKITQLFERSALSPNGGRVVAYEIRDGVTDAVITTVPRRYVKIARV